MPLKRYLDGIPGIAGQTEVIHAAIAATIENRRRLGALYVHRGTHDEAVRAFERALLVEPEDVAAWASALHELIRRPCLRGQLGAAARATLARKYTWRARAQKVLADL